MRSTPPTPPAIGRSRAEPTSLEAGARESLEVRRGTAFTEEEWWEAKENLLAFFTRLSRWEAIPELHNHQKGDLVMHRIELSLKGSVNDTVSRELSDESALLIFVRLKEKLAELSEGSGSRKTRGRKKGTGESVPSGAPSPAPTSSTSSSEK